MSAVRHERYAALHETKSRNRMSRPRGQRVTVRDLAAETGVSIATVSRVLNNQANVAPHTRELVQRAVERLSEQAPGPRTVPARATQGAVYLRCPYLLTDYFGLIVSSIAETLELHDRPVLLNAGEAAQQAAVLPALAITARHRRRHHRAAAGAQRATGGPAGPRVPLRRGGSPRPDAARHRRRVGRALRRRPQHQHAPGRLGAPAHRRDGRAAQLARERRAPRRPRVGPGERRGAARSRAGPQRRADHAVRLPRGRRTARPASSRPPRSSGSTTRSPSARWPPPRSADCAYPRTSPSSASTTSTSPRPPAPCSPPSVSRCRKWAASPSAS